MTADRSLLEDLLALATELALSAGSILVEGRRSVDLDVRSKSTSVDVVTALDLASEHHIVEVIRTRRPDDGILGEEGTSFAGTSGVRWVIDPLDGTVNFLYGIPMFCVSIGVEIDGIPVVGVVHNPALDETFTAFIGGGAYLNGSSITVRDEQVLELSLLATGFAYAPSDRAAQADVLHPILPRVRDIRRAGAAALDLCNVACGRVDAYYEVGIKPWDMAAGRVIATEAGATVTGVDLDEPTTSVIAANPVLHKALSELF